MTLHYTACNTECVEHTVQCATFQPTKYDTIHVSRFSIRCDAKINKAIPFHFLMIDVRGKRHAGNTILGALVL